MINRPILMEMPILSMTSVTWSPTGLNFIFGKVASLQCCQVALEIVEILTKTVNAPFPHSTLALLRQILIVNHTTNQIFCMYGLRKMNDSSLTIFFIWLCWLLSVRLKSGIEWMQPRWIHESASHSLWVICNSEIIVRFHKFVVSRH